MQLFEQSIRRFFFDRAAVLDRLSEAEHNVLMRAAGRVWKTARRRIRNRKSASKPGASPTNQTGHLRYGIEFAYDPTDGGAIVGPQKLNIVYFNGNRKPVRGTVPSVLEEGGQITVLEEHASSGPGGWRRVDLRRISTSFIRRFRTVTIAARPFMRPSLEANLKYLPEEFRDSVKA